MHRPPGKWLHHYTPPGGNTCYPTPGKRLAGIATRPASSEPTGYEQSCRSGLGLTESRPSSHPLSGRGLTYLLGNTAYWLERPIRWDPAAQTIIGNEEAARMMARAPWRA